MTISLKYTIEVPKINASILFLWFVFYLSPFIDALTGYLVLSGTLAESSIGSPSQLFRFFLFTYALYYIRHPNRILIYVVALGYLFLIETVSFFVFRSSSAFISGLVISYKLVFAIVLYFVFKNFFEKGILSAKYLLDLTIRSGLIYAGILILSILLGISFSTYATQGSKGLFASGNGLSFFLGVVFLVALYRYFNCRNTLNFLGCLFLATALLLITTKASLIYLIIGLILLFIKSKIQWRILITLFVLFIIIYYGKEIYQLIEVSFKIMIFRFKMSDSIWEALLSGRTYYLNYAIDQYNLSGGLFYRFLIGAGYFVAYRNPLDFHTSSYINVMEMDSLDLFFMYGIVGLIVYITVFYKGFSYSLQLKTKYFFLLWSLILLNSALSGHVFFNGMSIMAVVYVYSLMRFYANQDEGKRAIEISSE